MASSLNLNSTDIRDAVAEFSKQHNLASNTSSATSIAEEVGKSVSSVLETALSKFKTHSLDAGTLREQILANTHAIIDLYIFETGTKLDDILITVTGTGEMVEAAVIARTSKFHIRRPEEHLDCSKPPTVVVQGASASSDMHALVSLYEKTKRGLARARSLSLARTEMSFYRPHEKAVEGQVRATYGFTDLEDLFKEDLHEV